jgi:hypothetical protein
MSANSGDSDPRRWRSSPTMLPPHPQIGAAGYCDRGPSSSLATFRSGHDGRVSMVPSDPDRLLAWRKTLRSQALTTRKNIFRRRVLVFLPFYPAMSGPKPSPSLYGLFANL